MLLRVQCFRQPIRRWVTESGRRLSSMAYTLSIGKGSASDPVSVTLIDKPTSNPTAGNVVVKWLAAGVDPVDLAAASGDPNAELFRPLSEPNVGGTEGVGIVTAVGSGVEALETGDRVVPIKMGLGTWREASEVSVEDVVPIPSDLRMELAATLPGSPCTALRLLTDFETLGEGDVVLHSAAGSAVGTALVQLGQMRGLRMVSIVSETSRDYAPTVERLKLLGSEVAIGEPYLDSNGFRAVMADLPAPKMAFHGASQQVCAAIAPVLRKSCPVVTYCPGTVDSGALTKAGLTEKTFSFAKWLTQASREDIQRMVLEVAGLMQDGALTGWLQRVKFDDLPTAIRQGGTTRRKLVAMMDKVQ